MIKQHVPFVLAIMLFDCGQGTRPPGPRSADSSEDQIILNKLQSYMSCLDQSARVFEIADLYRAHLGDKAAARETGVSVQMFSDPKPCLKGIVDANKLEPHLPELEAAGEAYAKAIDAVFTLTTAGHNYFDRSSENFDPAKGSALQPELLGAFGAFDAAQGALFDQVYRLNRKAHQDQLALREKKDGRTLPIIADDMMFHAEDLVRFAAIPWDHLDKLDLAAFTTSLEAFETSVDEMVSYSAANPKKSDALFKDPWTFKQEVKGYLIAAEQLLSRARDHLAYTDAEKIMIAANNERSVIGTPAAMIDAYNRVVDTYRPEQQ
jgi:hypothetical protein